MKYAALLKARRARDAAQKKLEAEIKKAFPVWRTCFYTRGKSQIRAVVSRVHDERVFVKGGKYVTGDYPIHYSRFMEDQIAGAEEE